MGNRRGNSGGMGSTKIFVVGAIVFIVLLVTALCFVIVLKPADSEYNNTIPAFMGILTIVSSAISALIVLLKQDQQHKENSQKITAVTESVVENQQKISDVSDSIGAVVADAIQHVTQELPIPKSLVKEGDNA